MNRIINQSVLIANLVSLLSTKDKDINKLK